MKLAQKKALAYKLLTLADDELILGHRNSEWCGHAPILEEDIAFANLALDEIGHAHLWYRLHASLLGEDPENYPDKLVFFREAFEYRNTHFVALPKGDWAFSMLRQYLFDELEAIRLDHFSRSPFGQLADTALKIRTEEVYHLRHTRAWVKRLGLGSAESNQRMQRALDELWPYSGQLFFPVKGEEQLVQDGVLPDPEKLGSEWESQVRPFLTAANLVIPDGSPRTLSRELQSQYLIDILAEMQQVARIDPQAKW